MSLSFVSSSQLCNITFPLPLSFFAGCRPSNAVFTKELWCNACPNYLYCLILSVSMSSFLVSTVLRTSLFFMCSVQDTFNMWRQIHISNVSILFMSLFCNVHVFMRESCNCYPAGRRQQIATRPSVAAMVSCEISGPSAWRISSPGPAAVVSSGRGWDAVWQTAPL